MMFTFLTLNRSRRHALAASLALAAAAAQAADGLQPPAADALWPHWQARIALQSGTPSLLSATGLADAAQSRRGVRGAALLGDYYFAGQALGGFRASGGLLVGQPGGTPLGGSDAGPGLGWNLNNSSLQASPGVYEGPSASTYLGLGYSSRSFWAAGLSLTADIGLLSERPATAWGAARALFGNAGGEPSLRDWRLSPLLQLGLLYRF